MASDIEQVVVKPDGITVKTSTPAGMKVVFDDAPVVDATFGKQKATYHMLPPVPDAVVAVGEVETELGDIYIGDTPPLNPSIGKLWIDTGELP